MISNWKNILKENKYHVTTVEDVWKLYDNQVITRNEANRLLEQL